MQTGMDFQRFGGWHHLSVNHPTEWYMSLGGSIKRHGSIVKHYDIG